ncbi:pentapeptide repeat-containing protein [Mycobacterium sp. CBMA271]|nr:pentapeptide repeat-containing protein [Mycobacteroides sp. CBMA 271]
MWPKASRLFASSQQKRRSRLRFGLAFDASPGLSICASIYHPSATPPSKIAKSLRAANLNEAILDNANLAGADLRRTELSNASLANTNLTGANLEGHKTAGLEARGAVLNDPHWAEMFSTYPFTTPHTAAARSKKTSDEAKGAP